MAAFVDASSACSAADYVFQTSSLRPFLNHPGIDKAGTVFHKPVNPEHAVKERQAAASLSLRPFHAPAKDSAPSRPGKCRTRPRGLMANNFSQTMPPPRQSKVSDANCPVQMYIGQRSFGATHSKEQNRLASSEDDLASVQFLEEPDDPRVAVPAHRIGDEPEGRLRPYLASDRSKKKPGLPNPPTLCLTAKPKPLHSSAPLPAKGPTKPVLANAGLLQFMLPNFGFPPTIAEEASLEQLLLSPSNHAERFELLET
ncbi:btbd6a [Symbiodinium natans]|uniref:Btbd6a protein n=1 Tax=Symbiodinium natans TaxID=878477 RepID=A0A812NIW2_9DINO|nr:btbd6a [Symbiodinium natans]